MFVTIMIFAVSAAPLATFFTVAFNAAEWSFGKITASTPAASAVLIHAPRLCGSITLSSTSIIEDSPGNWEHRSVNVISC